ncbi:MAG: hypothetical protein ABSG53_32435, partial [Thermoguttaceae bacterium]
MMATYTCGGEIGGYCATGKENTAIPPASVMTMDSTVAKIGRSMKKCEITAPPRTMFRHYSKTSNNWLPWVVVIACLSSQPQVAITA